VLRSCSAALLASAAAQLVISPPDGTNAPTLGLYSAMKPPWVLSSLATWPDICAVRLVTVLPAGGVGGDSVTVPPRWVSMSSSHWFWLVTCPTARWLSVPQLTEILPRSSRWPANCSWLPSE